MTSLALALVASMATASSATPCCSGHEDWRADLPADVRAIVARVDAQEQVKPGETTAGNFENAQHEKDVKADIEMGRKYSAEVDKQLKASEKIDQIERLQRIGRELSVIANEDKVEVLWGDKRLNPFPYSFHLVEGKDVNAFSMPGGYIYFYEGLLDYCESDDELAGVVAHEIAHAAFRHVATLRKESQKFDLLQVPLLIAAIITGNSDIMAASQAAGFTAQAYTSAWSVKAETASDYGAIQYMGKSKYNPVGVLTFMERLAYRDRSGPQIDWGIYKTHPPSKERAEFIQTELREAGIPILRSKVSTSLAAKTDIDDNNALVLRFGTLTLHKFRGDGAIDRAEDAVLRLNRFFDTVPAVYEVTRSGARILGNGRVLFEVKPEDLESGHDLDAGVAETLKQMRSAVFDLNYRLWNQKDVGLAVR